MRLIELTAVLTDVYVPPILMQLLGLAAFHGPCGIFRSVFIFLDSFFCFTILIRLPQLFSDHVVRVRLCISNISDERPIVRYVMFY